MAHYSSDINLYSKGAMRDLIRSQQTKLDLIQGKIAAIISDSQIAQYEDGSGTMYSALAALQLDLEGLHADFSQLESVIDNEETGITRINSRLAEYDQTLEGFSNTISDTQTQLGSISVGSVNLLPGTRAFDMDAGSAVLTYDAFNGCKVRKQENTSMVWESGCEYVLSGDILSDLNVGRTAFMVSFWAKGSGTVSVQAVDYNGSGEFSAGSMKPTSVLRSEWERYSVPVTCTALPDLTDPELEVRLLIGAHGNSTMYICGVKLEKGNIATDWCPAPEDGEKEISAASEKITQLSGDLEGITGRVSSVEKSVNTWTDEQGAVHKGLIARMADAESKISQEAIVNTVKSSMTFATAEEMEAVEEDLGTAANDISDLKGTTFGEGGLVSRMASAEQKITSDAIVSTVRSMLDLKVHNMFSVSDLVPNGYGTIQKSDSRSITIAQLDPDTSSAATTVYISVNTFMYLATDTVYTLSFNFHKVTRTDTTLNNFRIVTEGAVISAATLDGINIYGAKDYTKLATIGDNENHHRAVLTFKKVATDGYIRIYINGAYRYPVVVKYWDIQIEKGTSASEWTPRSADLDDYVTGRSAYLESKIEQTAGEIRAEAAQIRLKAETLVWDADNSSMDEEGNFSCINGQFSGNITSSIFAGGEVYSGDVTVAPFINDGKYYYTEWTVYNNDIVSEVIPNPDSDDIILIDDDGDYVPYPYSDVETISYSTEEIRSIISRSITEKDAWGNERTASTTFRVFDDTLTPVLWVSPYGVGVDKLNIQNSMIALTKANGIVFNRAPSNGKEQILRSANYWLYTPNPDEVIIYDDFSIKTADLVQYKKHNNDAIGLFLEQMMFVSMATVPWLAITNIGDNHPISQDSGSVYYLGRAANRPLYKGINLFANVIANNFYCRHKKNRIIDTRHYGSRLQYAYETATPYFGDLGEGETDENGICYVEVDDIFGETVAIKNTYHVFLQKEGPGDLWVDEKSSAYFVVKGTPNTKFSWELKAVQADFTQERLEDFSFEDNDFEGDDAELDTVFDKWNEAELAQEEDY